MNRPRLFCSYSKIIRIYIDTHWFTMTVHIIVAKSRTLAHTTKKFAWSWSQKSDCVVLKAFQQNSSSTVWLFLFSKTGADRFPPFYGIWSGISELHNKPSQGYWRNEIIPRFSQGRMALGPSRRHSLFRSVSRSVLKKGDYWQAGRKVSILLLN